MVVGTIRTGHRGRGARVGVERDLVATRGLGPLTAHHLQGTAAGLRELEVVVVAAGVVMTRDQGHLAERTTDIAVIEVEGEVDVAMKSPTMRMSPPPLRLISLLWVTSCSSDLVCQLPRLLLFCASFKQMRWQGSTAAGPPCPCQ